jgi:probable F420-dependent oxidoreductase
MSSPTFGIVVPTYGPFADPAQLWKVVDAAEELGYASVWFGDHIVVPPYAAALTPADWFDAVALCLVGLGRTNRLRFGTDVLVAPYRHPVVLAHLAASADRLSGGRLTLGMGVGFLEGEFDALQTPYAERGAVTDEYLAVMRLLWESQGKPVSYEGQWVQFHDILFGPAPLQSPLPLLIGGNGERAFRRAALLGDGWHPLFCEPSVYAAGRERIHEIRGSLDGFSFSYSCPQTRVLDDPSAGAQGYTYQAEGALPADYSYVPAVPTAPGGRSRFMGTPEQLGEDIAVFTAVGVEHFALRFSVGLPDDSAAAVIAQLELFATQVLPLVEGVSA